MLSVPEIPPVPAELKTAARQGRLVIFVGAGVSRLLGGPSWAEFSDRLLKQLAGNNYLSFSEVKQLESLDAKKKISIACDVCETSGISADYRSLLMPALPGDAPRAIYEDLYAIGAAFVTTNYDEWIDERAEQPHPARSGIAMEDAAASPVAPPTRSRKVYYQLDDLTIDRLTVPGNVVHLHGSVRDSKTMILTTRNYLDHYQNGMVVRFLDELFSRYVVLFVGYSVEEDEIVEHILRKVNPGGSATTVGHYRLIPRYGHEDFLFEKLSNYFRVHRGVELIGYSIDRQGDRQLIDVVAHWSKELRQHVREQAVLEKLRLIDEAVDET